MLINLSDVLSGNNKTLQTCVKSDIVAIDVGMSSYRISEAYDINIDIINVGDRNLSVDVTCTITIDIPCDRCLSDVKRKFDINIHKDIDMNKTDEDRLDEQDEKEYIVGLELDVNQLIFTEILLQWPMKVLCKEECKGICKKCGGNLNEVDCGCDQLVLDPRMAAIRDIFNNSKQ